MGADQLRGDEEAGREAAQRQLRRGHVVALPRAAIERDYETMTHVPPTGQPIEQLPERYHPEVPLEEVAVVAERFTDAVKQHDDGSIL